MQNSMDQSVPIRVIRGHRNIHSYSGKIYSYGGLYKVSFKFIHVSVLVKDFMSTRFDHLII